MPSATGPILAVIDRVADDADVVAEAVWLARAAQSSVLLVHVARPVRAGAGSSERAIRLTGLELRVVRELQRLAEQVRNAGVVARVDDVYFGDPSAQVAYAASRRRASAVVAARRPSRFSRLLAWRSRDVRLGRLLRVPLVLIDPVAVQPRSALAEFELEPGLRPVEQEGRQTTRDLRQQAA